MHKQRTTENGTMAIDSRDIAYCGIFGAAGLLLPAVFHLLKLGHIFMPMYLPLVALTYFTRSASSAALTALLVPLISGAVTGMPPFYPPIAPVMSVELALMALLTGQIRKARKQLPVWLVLLIVLAAGRIINTMLLYCAAHTMQLPAKFTAGISFISGWPGIFLMMAVIPRLVALSNLKRGF
ncbi:MAG: hypothetical protein R6V06_00950 [Kiritimatiellia bacterium]